MTMMLKTTVTTTMESFRAAELPQLIQVMQLGGLLKRKCLGDVVDCDDDDGGGVHLLKR